MTVSGLGGGSERGSRRRANPTHAMRLHELDTWQISKSNAGNKRPGTGVYSVHVQNASRRADADACSSGGVYCLYPSLLPQILSMLNPRMQPGFVILMRLKSFSGSLSRVLMCL